MQNKTIATLLAIPLAISNAWAQDSGSEAVKVSGFGTVALTRTDTNDALFSRPFQAAGANKSARFGVDSNLGLQADVRINDWLSLTGQGLVRKLATDSYEGTATLAFVKARLSDEVSVRAGRVPLAAFLVSDYRNVGYANTMLRPVQEVYGQVPFDSLDGIDLEWRQEIGSSMLTTQVAFGRSTSKVAGTTFRFTNGRILNVVLEQGPFTLRLGRDDVRMPVGQGAVEPPKSKVSFTAAGASMDWKNIVLQSEYTVARGYGAVSKGWYAMGGYRFGKLLPFVSHGKVSGDIAQSTDSVGLRWDAFRSADIKFQVDRVKPVGGGLFNQPQPGFKGPVTVGAVAVDFVF